MGYRVLLSDDGKEWRSVFSVRQYPPDEDGLVKIYFKPEITKLIRVSQIGTHEYASWIVNEIEIYEAI